MKKSLINTLVMIVILAGMVAWYLIYEKRVRPEQKIAEEKEKLLFTEKQDAIQYITISPRQPKTADAKNPAEPTIKLKKTGNDWSIIEPITDTAENANVTQILNTLATTSYERIVEEHAKDLATYGLSDPSLKVTLTKDANSPGETILLGDDTPVGAGVYAKTAQGDTVYKMPASFKSSLNKKLFDLRNKRLIDFARFEVSEVEVQEGKDSFLLTKGAKEDWMLARDNIPADTSEVNKLLTATVDLRAKTFASEDGKNLAQYGLASPAVKVALTKGKDKDKKQVSLWLGKTKDKFYAKREDKPVVIEIEKDAFEKASRPGTAYRSLELAKFNRFDVNQIRLERGHQLIDLTKDDKDWSLVGEPKFKVDTTKVDGLLAQLQDTKALKYLSKADSKLVKSPALKVQIFEKSGTKDKPKVILVFGKKQKDFIPVVREGLDLPLAIKEADFSKIDLGKHVFEKAPEPTAAPKVQEEKSGLNPASPNKS